MISIVKDAFIAPAEWFYTLMIASNTWYLYLTAIVFVFFFTFVIMPFGNALGGIAERRSAERSKNLKSSSQNGKKRKRG